MSKFHIGKDNVIRKCRAEKKTCPLINYDSEKQAKRVLVEKIRENFVMPLNRESKIVCQKLVDAGVSPVVVGGSVRRVS